MRSRFLQEIDDERLRGVAELRKENHIHEENLLKQKNLHDEKIEKLKLEHSLELEQAAKRSDLSILNLKEKYKIERESWLSQMKMKLDKELKVKEKELNERLNKEREEELEVVITKLQEETTNEKVFNFINSLFYWRFPLKQLTLDKSN